MNDPVFHPVSPAGHPAMARLLDTIPFLPRCSDNKTAALVRPRAYAVRLPYVQVNRPSMVSWLIFDLDHDNPNIWQDTNCPPPNFVISDRDSKHAHLYYAITPVCTSDKGRRAPIDYMKAVYQGLAKKLQADPAYAGTVAKTPHHPWWRTSELHGAVYSLGELADYCELETKPKWQSKVDTENDHSRHCVLFDELRHFAYSIVDEYRQNHTFDRFKERLARYALSRNTFLRRGFDADLPDSSVRATVKSVSRWTWERYCGDGRCNRGVMALDASMPLAERQSVAARRTHGERKGKTAKKVMAACKLLISKGESLTLQAVAAASGLSRQTVSKYKSVMAAVGEKSNIIPLADLMRHSCNVNFATYQITAPLLDLPASQDLSVISLSDRSTESDSKVQTPPS